MTKMGSREGARAKRASTTRAYPSGPAPRTGATPGTAVTADAAATTQTATVRSPSSTATTCAGARSTGRTSAALPTPASSKPMLRSCPLRRRRAHRRRRRVRRLRPSRGFPPRGPAIRRGSPPPTAAIAAAAHGIRIAISRARSCIATRKGRWGATRAIPYLAATPSPPPRRRAPRPWMTRIPSTRSWLTGGCATRATGLKTRAPAARVGPSPPPRPSRTDTASRRAGPCGPPCRSSSS
mmetsp:Transcript_17168/g.49809  ORF Transcript_17168/g.49809 Transcript_17168/m.49809 type:complete len:239 (-) Transcript_17168:1196-1912(-)